MMMIILLLLMGVMILIHFKSNIIGKINYGHIENVKIMVPLKYLSNFWRTLEMPLINCEIELILTWSQNCVIISYFINSR